MEVTIVLGQRAKEFVTGIPLEELSDILSDVLEQSLEKQVAQIEQKEDSKHELLLEKIKEMFQEVKVQPTDSYSAGFNSGTELPTTEKKIKTSVVESPIILDGDLSMFDFLK